MQRLCFYALIPLALLAQSASDQSVLNRRDLRVTPGAVANSSAVPRGYALVIGISHYKNLDPEQNLRYPESDAEAIYRVLISQEGGAFPADNVHLLKGSQATIANMRHELEEWLPSMAQPADRVVVYFAGHGLVVQGRGYFSAWDVDLARPESTAYPMDRLGDVLANRVKAHWKVLLTDACHSGKMNAETTNETVDDQFRKLPHDFLTFTAATAREQSFEDPQLSTGFGLFTYYLVQAWKGYADTDPCDGVITADELIEYVRTQVKKYAKERGASQTPTSSGDYAPDMPVGMSRGCMGATPAGPQMFGGLVIETNLDNVEVYVDGTLVGKLSGGSQPLVVPGLSAGPHKVDGVRQGYEPDHKEVVIAPGQDASVTLRIRYTKAVKKAALDAAGKGEALLLSHRSSLNLLRVEGLQSTNQSEPALQHARVLLTQALLEDPGFSKAAFDLGQVNQLLADEQGSMEAYRRAIQIDPGYVEARLQYGAVLIEGGDADEAIRQLTEAIRLEPKNDEAYALFARAYWDKGVWGQAIEMADRALSFRAGNEQAHLWKADATRQLGAAEKDQRRRTRLYQDARDGYKAFLDMTNYSTPAYDWFAFHFIGFGLGSRRHADRIQSYDELRSAGFLGLCLCDQRLGNPLQARAHCQRALKYDSADPITFFELGNVNRDLFNNTKRCEYLVAARQHYAKMLKLNADLAESKHARDYLEQIDSILPRVRKGGC